MRSLFGKGHRDDGTIYCSLLISRFAPHDCFEELDNDSPPPEQSHFLNRSNLLSDDNVFLN